MLTPTPLRNENCQRAQEQLTATLETNFEVDTTNFTTPGFIRLNQVNDRCNYPLLNPRFAYDSKNYQDCNFAFKGKGYPRCGSLTNNGNCSTTDIYTDSNTVAGDPYLFAGFINDNSPCYYWKLVNKLNEDDYLFDVTLSYFTDTSYEETIYTSQDGDPNIIDSSITFSTKNVDSCVPSNMRVKVTIVGVVGTIMEGINDFFILPSPAHNFVISLWYNQDIKSPSVSVGYVISEP